MSAARSSKRIAAVGVGIALLIAVLAILIPRSRREALSDLSTTNIASERSGAEFERSDAEAGSDARAALAPEPTAESVPNANRATSGSLRIQVVSSDGGRPIPGLRGEAYFYGEPAPWNALHAFVTDPSGEARLLNVPAGDVGLSLLNGVKSEASVRGGEETTLVIQVPPEMRVHGVVKNAEGTCVPGAEIWISGHGNTTLMRLIAEADSRGEFEFRHVPGNRSFCALSPAYVRSPLTRLVGVPGDTQEVELRFPADRPGSLTGRVTGLAETDVAALVVLSPLARQGPSAVERFANQLDSPIQRRGVVDAFEFTSLYPGSYELSVNAAGFMPTTTQIEILSGPNGPCVVQLASGISLSGTVIDGPTGNGVPGVYVSASSVELPGPYGAFSDADGRFAIAGLPAGDVRIFAEHPSLGMARRVVRAAADSAPVVLTLSRGLEIFGRITWSRCPAPPKLRVGIATEESIGSGYDAVATLDDGGEFRFWNREDRPYVINVFAMEAAGDGLLGRIGPVRPSDSPLTFDVDPALLPSAWVVGTVVDEAGQSLSGATLVIGTGKRGQGVTLDSRQTGLKVGPLIPREYAIDVSCQGYGTAELPLVRLDANQTVDLGVIVLRRPGSLEVSFVGFPASILNRMNCELRNSRDLSLQRFLLMKPTLDFGQLAEGKYVLECSWDGASRIRTEVAVKGGSRTNFSVDYSLQK